MSAPSFAIPPGACATVKVIDNNSKLGNLSTSIAVGPPIPGFDTFPTLPSLCFLIENPQGRKILYDLGIRPDWRKLPPVTVNRLESSPWELSADRHVADILKEHGVYEKDVEAIVWSHWHWDHIGCPSTFPSTTDLIVGPGFTEAFLPGYPANKNSPILESDYRDRRLIELDFSRSDCVQVGRMRACDYFGDGSFFILDAPGHAVGHLCGLVRTTTSPDTFVFLAGDAVHHQAELRPSPNLPIPSSISPHPLKPLDPVGSFCPGHILDDLQTARGLKPGEPFLNPLIGNCLDDVMLTIGKVQDLDHRENVLVILAHDTQVTKIVDLFPASINRWQAEGWGSLSRWCFLQDFDYFIRSAIEDQKDVHVT
ncbi:hypothetical protein FE257_001705 [Aspergillus nanangensis]|uniref:Metallo-beta-lactamase domain-containing protein n=1 Tax=Aspergillus nanangensis TaxID=2582783 RepID=A0AAD4GPI7_ASPNN|nr:hypothetical protein FE257_001705 [Aspergillus nanangensis]